MQGRWQAHALEEGNLKNGLEISEKSSVSYCYCALHSPRFLPALLEFHRVVLRVARCGVPQANPDQFQ